MKLLLLAIFCVCQALCAQPNWFVKYALPKEKAGKDLVQLAEELDLRLLVVALEKAGLADTIKTKGPFTLFAPTDEAFRSLPADLAKELLRNTSLLQGVLMYHAISGNVYSSQLKNDLLAPSLLKFPQDKSVNIRINIYEDGNVVTATGSKVIKVDQNATNGVIHVIDRVMYPIPAYDMVATLQVKGMKEHFSTLVTAVMAAGLVETLEGAGPFTLFAPVNEAFAKIPNLPDILKNKTLLTDILTYHVISGTYFSSGLTTGAVKTVEGKDVQIDINGSSGVMVNHARVVYADLAVSNGVIHLIDDVLIPPKTPAKLSPWDNLMKSRSEERL